MLSLYYIHRYIWVEIKIIYSSSMFFMLGFVYTLSDTKLWKWVVLLTCNTNLHTNCIKGYLVMSWLFCKIAMHVVSFHYFLCLTSYFSQINQWFQFRLSLSACYTISISSSLYPVQLTRCWGVFPTSYISYS